MRWQNALNHGQVLARNTYAEMVGGAPGPTYGLGIGRGSNAGHRVLFHAGGIDGFDAMIADYPDDDVAIAVLANTDGDLTNEIEGRIARLVLNIPDPAAQPLTAEVRKSVVGKYHASRGFDVTIVVHGEALFLESEGDPSIP